MFALFWTTLKIVVAVVVIIRIIEIVVSTFL